VDELGDVGNKPSVRLTTVAPPDHVLFSAPWRVMLFVVDASWVWSRSLVETANPELLPLPETTTAACEIPVNETSAREARDMVFSFIYSVEYGGLVGVSAY
jgi:hypothetical protein